MFPSEKERTEENCEQPKNRDRMGRCVEKGTMDKWGATGKDMFQVNGEENCS